MHRGKGQGTVTVVNQSDPPEVLVPRINKETLYYRFNRDSLASIESSYDYSTHQQGEHTESTYTGYNTVRGTTTADDGYEALKFTHQTVIPGGLQASRESGYHRLSWGMVGGPQESESRLRRHVETSDGTVTSNTAYTVAHLVHGGWSAQDGEVEVQGRRYTGAANGDGAEEERDLPVQVLDQRRVRPPVGHGRRPAHRSERCERH